MGLGLFKIHNTYRECCVYFYSMTAAVLIWGSFLTFSLLNSRKGVKLKVSLNEWELSGKLAHQNTSQLSNNRKRPCKQGQLWLNFVFALREIHSRIVAKMVLLQLTNTIVFTNLTWKNTSFNCWKVCPWHNTKHPHQRWFINRRENLTLYLCDNV